jgi:hypothetical protein
VNRQLYAMSLSCGETVAVSFERMMGGLWTLREQTNYYRPQPGLDIRLFVVETLPVIIH